MNRKNIPFECFYSPLQKVWKERLDAMLPPDSPANIAANTASYPAFQEKWNQCVKDVCNNFMEYYKI